MVKMNKPKYLGGVEGGASRSNLVIVDADGEILGTADGPLTNHWHIGIDECANRIIAMLHTAKKKAGIPVDTPLDALGLSLSGCEHEDSDAELVARVREKDPLGAKAIYVGSDTSGSLATGAPFGGMVLIAGTGSNALLKTSNGETFGCGGWGHLLGDEGGAYWIAHTAMKIVFDQMDGLRRAPHDIDLVWTTLKEHFDVQSRADLLPHTYKHFDKSKFAAVTAILATRATSGDELSRHVFGCAGRALGAHVAALCPRIDTRPLRVVCVGSVFLSWPLLRTALFKALRERKVSVELQFIRLRVSSAMGAAWLAAKHIQYDLPRDDQAFCDVFDSYDPTYVTNGDSSDKYDCGCHTLFHDL